jgi:hypothetical protein
MGPHLRREEGSEYDGRPHRKQRLWQFLSCFVRIYFMRERIFRVVAWHWMSPRSCRDSTIYSVMRHVTGAPPFLVFIGATCDVCDGPC